MKHPTCNFALNSVREISRVISSRLIKRDPFSLIRLGDGEGLLLSISDQSSQADFRYMEGHLGPDGVDLDFLLQLKSRLKESIKDADVIGIRDDIVNVKFEADNFSLPHDEFLSNFQNNFKLREVEKSLDYHGSRRIAFLHRNLGNLNLSDSKQYCSAWFHYEYHIAGGIFRTLQQYKRIGLISCRPGLPGLLADLFGLSVMFHEIPDMFRNSSTNKASTNYIQQLENVLNQQLVEAPGMLYLVGGGLYGKLYCQLIQSQGGIALDLGSLFDAWLGLPSRPTVYKGMGEDGTTVPQNLLLTDENVVTLAK